MTMHGMHDTSLVVLSILIAMFASFTALSLASRVRRSSGRLRRVWAGAAAAALGGGIWAMHFIAMLAFSMPGMGVGFDLDLTLLSLLIALAFTGAGFSVMRWDAPAPRDIAAAGLLMGAGVVTMHYVGMAAMRMPATLTYSPPWVLISVLVAIGAAIAAVWLAAREQQLQHRLVAAVVMGVAIAGMHYAGMRAAVFTPIARADAAEGAASLGQGYLAVLIGGVTVLILLLALGAARLERVVHSLSRRESRIVLRLRIADALRGLGTGEALNEVAALLGRHFGVSRTGYGQLDPVEDVFDYDVCWTDGAAPPLIGRFPAAAFGAKIVAKLNRGETIVVDDLLTDGVSDAAARDTAREVDTRAILVVPFVRDGQLRTIIYLNDRRPRHWLPEEVAFLEEMAERTRLVIDRAAVEEELRQLNATLEARVAARTAELEQAQEALLQSQKMEAVGQLVAGLAHDFNNVLGAMVGAFDLVQRRADDPDKVQRFAEAGLQAGERGAKLTAQLLAFSRSQRIELRPLFVCDVIEALDDLLRRTLGPMIRLNLRLNPAPVPVLADATQVEMMVLNLAINARDAMPAGGVLTIATGVHSIAGHAGLADGDYVEIVVGDTGTGMDEETLRRAMEPFFTTKPVGKGTGLGLAQIYGSVRQAGGTVHIESAPGVGTTVRMLLPCTDQRPVRAAEVAAGSAPEGARSANVLLVDDDRDLRGVIATALEAQGYAVVQAGDGLAALAALETGLPDVAVIDFAMPGMTGAELARRIAGRWPNLPLIFASGFSDTDAIEAATGGAVTMLRKPFRVDELLGAIDAALATSSAL